MTNTTKPQKLGGTMWSENCKAMVYGSRAFLPSRCSKPATRDGFCGTHHPDAKARRERKRVEATKAANAQWERRRKQEKYERACVNALAGIPDPAAWREAVERLVEVARLWAELPESLSADDDEALSDAVRAVLALQSPREEEKSDAD